MSGGDFFHGLRYVAIAAVVIQSPVFLLDWGYLLGFKFRWIHRVMFAPAVCAGVRQSTKFMALAISRRKVSDPVSISSTGEGAAMQREITDHSGSSENSLQLPTPVALRGFWSLVAYNFGVMCVWSCSTWTVVFDLPCIAPFFLAVFGNFFSQWIFIERTIRLYLQFRITEEARSHGHRQFAEQEETVSCGGVSCWKLSVDWMLRKRSIILRDSPFSPTMIIAYVISSIITAGFTYDFQAKFTDHNLSELRTSSLECQVNLLKTFKIVNVLIFVGVSVRLFFVRLMKTLVDNFGIKSELTLLGLAPLASAVLCAVCIYSPDLESIVKSPIYWYFMYLSSTISASVCHFCNIWILFKRTTAFHQVTGSPSHPDSSIAEDLELEESKGEGFRENATTEDNSVQSVTIASRIQIHQVLNNPEAAKIFEAFLMRDFSIENLMAYQAVQGLEDQMSQHLISEQQAKALCIKIAREFCEPGCKLPVNISGEVRHAVLNRILNPNQEVVLSDALRALGKMKKQVFSLLVYDTFRRFKADKSFEQVRQLLDGSVNKMTTITELTTVNE